MILQMLFSFPVALAIGFSAQVAGQENRIPDQAREILENATQFELLSIGYGSSTKNPPEDYHGWHVIGKATIKDPNARLRLVAALTDSPAPVFNQTLRHAKIPLAMEPGKKH